MTEKAPWVLFDCFKRNHCTLDFHFFKLTNHMIPERSEIVGFEIGILQKKLLENFQMKIREFRKPKRISKKI